MTFIYKLFMPQSSLKKLYLLFRTVQGGFAVGICVLAVYSRNKAMAGQRPGLAAHSPRDSGR